MVSKTFHINKRETCYRRLEEIYNFAQSADQGANEKLMFLHNYTDVAQITDDFESSHHKVIQDTKDEDFDKEDELRARFDKMRRLITFKYFVLTPQPEAAPASADATCSSVKLPKVTLPPFSGDLTAWPAFIALYDRSIHNNSKLTAIEKYQYLHLFVRGEALNVIKGLPLDEAHYSVAYDALSKRFQNKRKLASHYWHAIVNAKPLKMESPDALSKLVDAFNENIRALELIKLSVELKDFILFNLLLDKLTPALREKFESEHRKIEIPSFNQLIDYLTEHCQVLTTSHNSGSQTGGKPKGKDQSKLITSTFVTSASSCPICKEAHTVNKCTAFLKLSEKERYTKVKSLQPCLNCLKAGHRVDKCPSNWKCLKCSVKHHTLLHFKSISSSTVEPPTSSSNTSEKSSAEADSSVVSLTSTSQNDSVVLLATVRAELSDAKGDWTPVRVLLDSASQSSFVTENCIQRSGIGRSPCRMLVLGLGDTKAASARGRASITLRPRGRDDLRFSVEATIVTRISSLLPHHRVPFQSWPHIRGLALADPEYYQPGSIDILLGAEQFVSLLGQGSRRGRSGEPDALNTIFGWVLMGAVNTPGQSVHSLVSTIDNIDASMQQFWTVEEVPVSTSMSDDDQRCENLFKETTRRDAFGRFIVSYPFAGELPCFVDSRQIAHSRFRSLERKFKMDSAFRLQYHALMRDYLTSGHMELVAQPAPTDGHVYYLPHHGVAKLDSETTKLRVVFDASSKCTNGIALNQTLLSGPKLQQNIVSILLRFRLGAVAVTADVKQMFRQIWIEPLQRDYQRIVWRFNDSEPISDYRLTTVTFGVTPSPYLAIRCLNQLAEDGRHSHPRAARALRSSLYVDDVVASVDSADEARKLRDQLNELLGSAGFELRKWASSHDSVLSDMDPTHCSTSMLSFDSKEDNFLKILGLRWYAHTDCFGFRVQPLARECSKRVILSELARIFDPLGFLAPLTFAAKLLIQQLWTLGLDWDDRPPAEICCQWNRYQKELKKLSSLRISRTLFYTSILRTELHGFCDASERGYGAVVYLRVVTSEKTFVRLLIGKSKVAPLKSLSLPRLELCAALLLSNLLHYLVEVLKESVVLDAVFAWSDSTVTLAWIQSSPHKLETFVRNRVARIQENTATAAWGHVDTKSNPADHCSRGLYPQELVECRLWWAGPDWLPQFQAPFNFDSSASETQVVPPVSLVIVESTFSFHYLLERFSSLKKICRIIAYSLRFIKNSRRRSVPASWAVDQLEAHDALLELVKAVQAESFAVDLANINHKRKVSKELRKLAPFIDKHGVLRVGGRLVCSSLPYEAKHPALIPSRHRLTELLIERIHNENLHPGRRALQYLITQHFWILGVQRAIKRTLSRCLRCFRVNPRIAQPLMADLPSSRVNQVKPFHATGVDFAGPFSVTPYRARGSKSLKAYVCLFVCFTTKAIHLELVSSLSTDAFLAALRRFMARRGRCALLFSDCGTNFVGASREILQHMKHASEMEQIRWAFNPPAAPHFGGLWEAGVKAFKTHLNRVIGEQILSLEEFYTVLAQIEAILNSRPLCPLSDDPNDLDVLTPGHFLTTEALVSLPSPDLTSLSINRLDWWQLLQRMFQDFWKRWHLEYLQTLQQRPKWHSNDVHLVEGSLVVIRKTNVPPLRWKLGRIVELHPGSDTVARVATVRTTEGILTRPLVKLCPLPMGPPSQED